jgi:hypothetical protein
VSRLIKRVTLGDFARGLEKMPDEIEAAIIRGLRSAALRGVGIVKEEIATSKPHPAVDKGDLIRSVHYSPGKRGGFVVVDAPHAAFVEMGTRPHWPPFLPIYRWVQRKITRDEYKAAAIAKRVRAKIAAHGTEPRHFMRKAARRIKLIMPIEVERELEKI